MESVWFVELLRIFPCNKCQCEQCLDVWLRGFLRNQSQPCRLLQSKTLDHKSGPSAGNWIIKGRKKLRNFPQTVKIRIEISCWNDWFLQSVNALILSTVQYIIIAIYLCYRWDLQWVSPVISMRERGDGCVQSSVCLMLMTGALCECLVGRQRETVECLIFSGLGCGLQCLHEFCPLFLSLMVYSFLCVFLSDQSDRLSDSSLL